MPTHAECGIEVVKFILDSVDKKSFCIPGDIPLQYLSLKTGYTPQLIGSSFEDNIKKALLANGIISRKAGIPGKIQLTNK